MRAAQPKQSLISISLVVKEVPVAKEVSREAVEVPAKSPDVVEGSRLVNHCPPASRIFHGHQTILGIMHKFFAQDTQNQKIYVLYGLGGAGKTQIALKFTEESTCFTDRLLLDASTTETIQNGLRNIATAKDAGTTSQDALTWLASKRENWLLFFDNADDPEINLNHFFPKCNHGNIVVTSRNPNLRGYGAHSQVSDMEESDAVTLLLKSGQQEMSVLNQLLAKDIVKALWYLPLAIVQAGAFILETGTLGTYLDLFLQNRTELLKKKSSQQHDDYAWAVYTTWEMSFSKLSFFAAMFLQLCAFLHWDNISEDIFSRAANYVMQLPQQPQYEQWWTEKLKSQFQRLLFPNKQSQALKDATTMSKEFLLHFLEVTGQWDTLSFLKVTLEIRAYSLLNFHPERKTFSIHPLVHSWTRTTLEDAESYHSCMDNILGMSIKEIQGHDMDFASLRLVSHVDSLLGVFTSNFRIQYAVVYFHARRYAEAKELEMIEMENCRELYGQDDSNTLTAMNNLADTYHKLGQFEEAEKLQVDVLGKRRMFLGVNNLDTVAAMNNLALTYGKLGRFKDAEKLAVMVLEKRRKLLGDDHPETLDAMYNLALAYHNLEQFEAARKLGVVVLEKRRRLLGDDHPETIYAMHSLANRYYYLGRFEEAKKLEIVVLEKRKKLFGEDHSDTLRAMNNLGYTYYHMGHLVEAEALQVIALEKRRVLFGDNHPKTQRVMRNLIKTYHGLGKQAEAAELEKLLEYRVKDVLEEEG
ncbi:FabD/lysophospholipase-like protein [Mycena sanguinolenta]|uniref:FabD/lysophospholipase-like protein n=1 Tax=Mycena sanguinolenta TaxID=230812 RepID=A0A8H6YY54_9AGAR|nr:FabD/lysophospholipase-like protein [Mycena sanguinolenta]